MLIVVISMVYSIPEPQYLNGIVETRKERSQRNARIKTVRLNVIVHQNDRNSSKD